MAYLRIADGCDNRCSYCAIPGIRGALRSRRLEDVLEEARRLVSEQRVQELVVVAQDTAAYGTDIYGCPSLPGLLHGLQQIEGLSWIRLMYLHPAHLDDAIIDAIASYDKVLPYLDIPVQHASDRILRLMNRKHDSTLLRALLAKLRSRIDRLVRTVMTSFPASEMILRLYDFILNQLLIG